MIITYIKENKDMMSKILDIYSNNDSQAMYVLDTETTTKEEDCRIWGWSLADVYKEKYTIVSNSTDLLVDLVTKARNTIFYFHNLKFDGKFLLTELFKRGWEIDLVEDKKVKENTVRISILDGKWFEMKFPNSVSIRDSSKIIDMSVAEIGEKFKLPIRKGSIDYDKERCVGYVPTDDEIKYMENDVEIVASALSIAKSYGLLYSKTIGGSAYKMAKKQITNFDKYFPQLPDYMEDFARECYSGGICQVNEKKIGKEIGKGKVYDVNSLYPYVMQFKKLPYGLPVITSGFVEPKADELSFYRVKFEYDLKEGCIPVLPVSHKIGNNTKFSKTSVGHQREFYLTSIDLELVKKCYYLDNIVYLETHTYKTKVGMFDEYLDYWTREKVKATIDGDAGRRQISKKMMNCLSGKFGTKRVHSKKVPYFECGEIKYKTIQERSEESYYVPVVAAITAYGREILVNAILSEYDKFLYCDTDSIHLECSWDYVPNIPIDSSQLGSWDEELKFNKAKYLSPKCYCEVYEKDGTEHTKATIAGLDKEKQINVKFEDFKDGAEYEILRPKDVKGGVVLVNTKFQIHQTIPEEVYTGFL